VSDPAKVLSERREGFVSLSVRWGGTSSAPSASRRCPDPQFVGVGGAESTTPVATSWRSGAPAVVKDREWVCPRGAASRGVPGNPGRITSKVTRTERSTCDHCVSGAPYKDRQATAPEPRSSDVPLPPHLATCCALKPQQSGRTASAGLSVSDRLDQVELFETEQRSLRWLAR